MIKSIYEAKPQNNKEYYAEVHHVQLGDVTFRKVEYENDTWQLDDRYLKVIMWEEAIKHSEEWDNRWIELHMQEIREAFNDADIQQCEVCISKGLLECLTDYEGFYEDDYVRLVDGIYVTRVL